MLLDVKNLQIGFRLEAGDFPVVDGVQLQMEAGKTLGLVGESGCGKSVTALSLIGLLPRLGSHIAGSVQFAGKNLLKLPESEMCQIRGNRIAMIFQEPMTALNPCYTIGNQVAEVYWTHEPVTKAEAEAMAVKILGHVGIPEPEKRIRQYPHELSGGMRQRIVIAMALACRPALLIADEPTTALDVTVQAQILDLIRDLQEEVGMGVLFITHDLGVVGQMCDDIAVMYCGRVIESGTVESVLQSPRHPYTRGLLNSMVSWDQPADQDLWTIEGTVPGIGQWPSGCRFRDRCPSSSERCRVEIPLLQLDCEREYACHHPLQGGGG